MTVIKANELKEYFSFRKRKRQFEDEKKRWDKEKKNLIKKMYNRIAKDFESYIFDEAVLRLVDETSVTLSSNSNNIKDMITECVTQQLHRAFLSEELMTGVVKEMYDYVQNESKDDLVILKSGFRSPILNKVELLRAKLGLNIVVEHDPKMHNIIELCTNYQSAELNFDRGIEIFLDGHEEQINGYAK